MAGSAAEASCGWRAWRCSCITRSVGYGTGLFKGAITPKLGGAAQVAHNSYISVLVEQGIVGFLLYMTMVLGVLRHGVQAAAA